MGQLQIPGTSVTYSNPLQKDQTTLIDSQTGKTWVIQPLSGGVSVLGQALTPPGPFSPQPGSFDATPPIAPTIAVNKPALSASDPSVGGKAIPGTSTNFKNPS